VGSLRITVQSEAFIPTPAQLDITDFDVIKGRNGPGLKVVTPEQDTHLPIQQHSRDAFSIMRGEPVRILHHGIG
jgi:hypothetical protein